MGYNDVYEAWKSDPEGFWMEAAQAIDWHEAPSKALFDKGGDMLAPRRCQSLRRRRDVVEGEKEMVLHRDRGRAGNLRSGADQRDQAACAGAFHRFGKP